MPGVCACACAYLSSVNQAFTGDYPFPVIEHAKSVNVFMSHYMYFNTDFKPFVVCRSEVTKLLFIAYIFFGKKCLILVFTYKRGSAVCEL